MSAISAMRHYAKHLAFSCSGGYPRAVRRLAQLLRPWALGLTRDRATGHRCYPVDGVRVFVRFPEETIRRRWRQRNFDEIYFACYRPTGSDTVVDFGAGLGHEIVQLAALEPGLRYFAVEVQPWVFECLCLTLAQLPAGYRPVGVTVGSGAAPSLTPTRSGDDVALDDGPVPVRQLDWPSFAAELGIDRVDLLKMNVEGAEVDILSSIDLAVVRRVIVNVHDFRADRGEGEHFRTRARVTDILGAAGFAVKEAAPDWLYAERPSGI